MIDKALSLVVGLGILNVWVLRRGTATPWRGGSAKTLREEFAAYGLPPWALGVGTFKVLFAVLLLAGWFWPALTRPAAVGLAAFMAGAIAMHLKVKDPARKSLPAAGLLILCLVIVFLQ